MLPFIDENTQYYSCDDFFDEYDDEMPSIKLFNGCKCTWGKQCLRCTRIESQRIALLGALEEIRLSPNKRLTCKQCSLDCPHDAEHYHDVCERGKYGHHYMSGGFFCTFQECFLVWKANFKRELYNELHTVKRKRSLDDDKERDNFNSIF